MKLGSPYLQNSNKAGITHMVCGILLYYEDQHVPATCALLGPLSTAAIAADVLLLSH